MKKIVELFKCLPNVPKNIEIQCALFLTHTRLKGKMTMQKQSGGMDIWNNCIKKIVMFFKKFVEKEKKRNTFNELMYYPLIKSMEKYKAMDFSGVFAIP